MPEAIVIDYKAIGYPFYILELDLTYLADRDLELLEEFVLKVINNGLRNISEISSFLGLGRQIVEKVLSELISRNLVIREDLLLKLTEGGINCLEKQIVLAPISETKSFYLDGLTGKLNYYFNSKS